MDQEFLLKTYSQMYGPEAGPWNRGVTNKYLEYRFTAFFEENFAVKSGDDLCNVGIGAGAWDRYLSYRLEGGTLTCIDIDPLCCRQLCEGLICEENPNHVEIICSDVMELELTNRFDIVTLVGSTERESGRGAALLEKAASFVKPGGSLYYQTLFEDLPEAQILETTRCCGMTPEAVEIEERYGFCCRYYKFTKK